ncbi:Protease production enhancer protein [Thiorhodovibrio winogradskyi]|uniref:Protease production enhancer protein n=1 Tax=Thiorhodovibrio winogradskyi TaxID=77007 RepID=A0ABZ0S5R0_9GAMM|nr:PAS domain S-box protein [Thiorhodovibrio winogradskyi]
MLPSLASLFTALLLGALLPGLWLGARHRQKSHLSSVGRSDAPLWTSSSLIDHLAESVIVLDGEGELRFASPSFQELLGIESPALLGRNLLDFVHPDEQSAVMEVLQWLKDADAEHVERLMPEPLGARPRLYSEQRLFTLAGWCWFGWSYTRLPADKGAASSIIGVGRDIGARKRVEQELRKTESILASVGDPVSLVDTNYVYRYVNTIYERLIGKPRVAIMGHRVSDILGEKVFNNQIKHRLDRCFEGETVTFDDWFELQPGSRSFMSMTYRPYRDDAGKVIGAAVTGRDNSALRRARDQVELALEKFRVVFEHFPLGILLIDALGNIAEANPVAHRLLEHGFNSYLGPYQGPQIEDPAWAFVDANQQPLTTSYLPMVRALRERCLVADEILGCLRADGSLLWLNVTAAPLPGSARAVVVALEDVTLRRSAEAAQQELLAMRESERRFRIMADGVPMILWVADQHGELEFANAVFRQFFGLPAEASGPLGQLWSQVLHREDLHSLQESLRANAHQPSGFEMQCRVRDRDGEWRWMQVSAAPHRASSGEVLGLVGAMQDISARRRAEAELRKSRDQLRERAERLARLTLQLTLTEQQERLRISCLLHDHLQQDMVAVKFQLAKLAANPSLVGQEGLAQAIALIDQAISTGRTLNADLNPPLLHHGSFGAALGWLAERFRARHGLQVHLRVELDLRFEQEQWRILLFESVRELLLNVVKHASVSEAVVTLRLEQGGGVLVRVEDAGCGFGLDDGASDAGMGLGLVAIHERLTLLDGRLTVASGAGLRGTRVALRVPLSKTSQEEVVVPRHLAGVARANRLPNASRTTRSLRILLADDHVMIRQALATLLNAEPDMQVVGEASDGFEAIELVQRLLPDVVIMDFTMPELDGPAATRLIREHWRQVRVIGLSVQEDERWAAEMRDAGAEDAISKAEVSEVLIERLRETV